MSHSLIFYEGFCRSRIFRRNYNMVMFSRSENGSELVTTLHVFYSLLGALYRYFNSIILSRANIQFIFKYLRIFCMFRDCDFSGKFRTNASK